MENTAKKMFETMASMQKQAVDNFNQMTENFQKNFPQNNVLDSDFFKKWYESQMAFFNQNSDKKAEGNPMEFFNTWMSNQMESATKWYEQFRNMPGMFTTGDNKAAYDNAMNMFNNWMGTLNNSYSEMLKNFGGNSDARESFTGMFNNAQTYMKMFELWMPMLKSVQDKSFTPEMFRNMFNAEIFKGMMDSIFNMQPEFLKNYSEKFNTSVKEGMNNWMDQSRSTYDQFRSSLNNWMPNSQDGFNRFSEMYNEFYNNMNNAAAPLMKLVTPGTQKEQLEMVNDMVNEFNQYHMKNAQMQYMMYVTGLKAMEELSENVYTKVRNGEDLNNFLNIYQEWLNINDKNFVKLFESDEYSKMQSELNSFGMKLKRKIDLQMEKSLANLPLINRSEMDELYKTIYDLKKKVTSLEKELATKSEPVAEVTVKTTKKTGKA